MAHVLGVISLGMLPTAVSFFLVRNLLKDMLTMTRCIGRKVRTHHFFNC